ncbi:MAG: Ig-like domain-containing protein [Gemmatimonadota bacterium]
MTSRRRERTRWWCTLGIFLAVVGVAGCARQGAPPGGPPDARPPVVVATTPEAFEDVPGFDGPVMFEFDERISEQSGGGTLDDAVTVSPSMGGVRVSHGRRSLSVEVDGGFRDGVVYRVTLLPVVRDMFGNALRDPFELVFTTGAEAEPTTIAGEIWDRVTGRGVPDLTLHAIGPDSLIHLAASGEEGLYAFRYLPGGTYTLTAFQDTNRDREVGPNELQGRVDFSVASGDTLFLDVPVLEPDTTSAILLGAEALDSVTVLLRFDDHLDPVVPLDEVDLTLADTTGAMVPVARRYYEVAYTEYATAVSDSLARVDSIARASELPAPDTPPGMELPDTLAVLDMPAAPDTVGLPGTDSAAVAVADSLRAPAAPQARRGPPPLPGPSAPGLAAARARGRVLPGRRMVLVLEHPLQPGVPHEVVVRGVVNVNGLGDGGGETGVVLEPPAEPAAPGGGGR